MRSSRSDIFHLQAEATRTAARKSSVLCLLPSLFCVSAGRKAFGLLSSVFCLLLVTGCRQDMHNQPKYRPLDASTLFADGSSARPLVEGTVARGTLEADEAFFTGKVGNQAVKELPFQVTEADLNRGQERYNIYCAPCHDATGSGTGMVVRRGYRQPPSFHDPRLKAADPGHFFDVITNGFGAMPDYRTPVEPRDRWRIVAYIRALQLSHAATTADVPGGNPDEANTQRQGAQQKPQGGGH